MAEQSVTFGRNCVTFGPKSGTFLGQRVTLLRKTVTLRGGKVSPIRAASVTQFGRSVTRIVTMAGKFVMPIFEYDGGLVGKRFLPSLAGYVTAPRSAYSGFCHSPLSRMSRNSFTRRAQSA